MLSSDASGILSRFVQGGGRRIIKEGRGFRVQKLPVSADC
jgi:hypothetical protein